MVWPTQVQQAKRMYRFGFHVRGIAREMNLTVEQVTAILREAFPQFKTRERRPVKTRFHRERPINPALLAIAKRASVGQTDAAPMSEGN